MKRTWYIAIVIAAVLLMCSAGSWAETASALLEKGIYTEEMVGDLDAAIKIYREIVDAADVNRKYAAEALYRLGTCHLKKGEKEKAAVAFKQLINHYPEEKSLVANARKQLPEKRSIEAESYSSKGWKLWGERKLEEAEKMFAKAVEIDPQFAHAWNGLGWSQFNQGKSLAAKESFEKCLAIDSKHPAALNGMGWIAKGEGKTKDALSYWEKAIAASPNATASLNGLASTYMELKQYDKAIKYYTMWLEVEPDSRFAKTGMQKAKAKAGLPDTDATLFDEKEIRKLITELSNPKASRFEALNLIIQMGKPSVPSLIQEMKTNNNWQIPKALGAIGDERAIEPLITKLEKCNWSPMKEVVSEALNLLTKKNFGENTAEWRNWWNSEGVKQYKSIQESGTQPDSQPESKRSPGSVVKVSDKWFMAGSRPQDYLKGTDTKVTRNGNPGFYLKSKSAASGSGFGTIMQNAKPRKYRGGKIRLSGYIKSVNVKNWAGLWMRVDGPGNEMLSFDNMQNRPIKGTSDWKKYEIVLDVPENSVNIAFGVLLTGRGQVWLNDMTLETVRASATTTEKMKSAEGGKISERWYLAGSRPGDYETGVDKKGLHKGKPSRYIKSTVSSVNGFGTMMQTIHPGEYLGKRVRMSGFVKANNIGNWAGLWMRVDGPGNEMLSFDNMQNRPIKGTSDWKKYEIVLDVPDNSVNIAFGLLLQGTGAAWLDDLQFEIVDKSVPTTQ